MKRRTLILSGVIVLLVLVLVKRNWTIETVPKADTTPQTGGGLTEQPVVAVIGNRILPNTDLPGQDMRQIITPTATECEVACQNDPKCSCYTWSSIHGNTCFMKTGTPPVPAIYKGITSGIISR